MFEIFFERKSAIIMALFLFICRSWAYSMHLTDTIYVIEPGGFEAGLDSGIYETDEPFRRDRFSIGISGGDSTSFWLLADQLSDEPSDAGSSRPGDTFVRFWHCVFDSNSSNLIIGYSISLRLPSGPDPEEEPCFLPYALNRHELKTGIVVQYNAFPGIFFHGNLYYVFRQTRNKAFYGKIRLNPVRKRTYSDFFGLNPLDDDSFISPEELGNDYIIVSLACNTDRLYPFIPFVESYVSSGFKGEEDEELADIIDEGQGGLVRICLGMRYFFSESSYVGAYVLRAPAVGCNGFNGVWGIEGSIQF